jgi:hypothetical protein
MNEVENEEEVLARQDEYQDYQLYVMLLEHAKELEEQAMAN